MNTNKSPKNSRFFAQNFREFFCAKFFGNFYFISFSEKYKKKISTFFGAKFLRFFCAKFSRIFLRKIFRKFLISFFFRKKICKKNSEIFLRKIFAIFFAQNFREFFWCNFFWRKNEITKLNFSRLFWAQKCFFVKTCHVFRVIRLQTTRYKQRISRTIRSIRVIISLITWWWVIVRPFGRNYILIERCAVQLN